MFKVYRQFGNSNPAGIEINLGYYALLECIVTNHHSKKVLQRWCGITEKIVGRKYGGRSKLDIQKLKQIMHDRFLTPQVISEYAGCSRQKISTMLSGNHYFQPQELIDRIEAGIGLEKGSLILKEG